MAPEWVCESWKSTLFFGVRKNPKDPPGQGSQGYTLEIHSPVPKWNQTAGDVGLWSSYDQTYDQRKTQHNPEQSAPLCSVLDLCIRGAPVWLPDVISTPMSFSWQLES